MCGAFGGARVNAHARDATAAIGAVLAALCCAGTPLIVSGLTGLGLGFLRNDGILWPAMLLALAIALAGFREGARAHGRWGPLVIGGLGALTLASGVIIVHGFPALQMIYGGGAALLVGAVWNSVERRRCNLLR